MSDDISQDELAQLISEFTFVRTLEARKEEFLPGHKYYKYGSYYRLERIILSYFSKDFSRKFPRGPVGVLKRGDYDTDPGSYAPCVRGNHYADNNDRLHFVRGEFGSRAREWNPTTICGYPIKFLLSFRQSSRAQQKVENILFENHKPPTARRRDNLIEARIDWVWINTPRRLRDDGCGVWKAAFTPASPTTSRSEVLMESFGLEEVLTNKATAFFNEQRNRPRSIEAMLNMAIHVKTLDLLRRNAKNNKDRRQIDQLRKAFIDHSADSVSRVDAPVFKSPDTYSVEKSTQSFLYSFALMQQLTSTMIDGFGSDRMRGKLFNYSLDRMYNNGFNVHFWANNKTEAEAFVSVLAGLVAPNSSGTEEPGIQLSFKEHTDDASIAIVMNNEEFKQARKQAMYAMAKMTSRLELLRESIENVDQYLSIYEDLVDTKSMDAPGVYQFNAAAGVE